MYFQQFEWWNDLDKFISFFCSRILWPKILVEAPERNGVSLALTKLFFASYFTIFFTMYALCNVTNTKLSRAEHLLIDCLLLHRVFDWFNRFIYYFLCIKFNSATKLTRCRAGNTKFCNLKVGNTKFLIFLGMLDLGKTLLKEDEWENVNSIFIDYIW